MAAVRGPLRLPPFLPLLLLAAMLLLLSATTIISASARAGGGDGGDGSGVAAAVASRNGRSYGGFAGAATGGASHRQLLDLKKALAAINQARAAAEAAVRQTASQMAALKAAVQRAPRKRRAAVATVALMQATALRYQAQVLADSGLKYVNAAAGGAAARPDVKKALVAARAALEAARKVALQAANGLETVANAALRGAR